MAFEPLEEALPLGTEFARLGAERLRKLALALDQRLRSVFVDSDADPLVLKNDTVGSGQLQDGAVLEVNLAVDSVITSKIQNAAVTEPKLANDSVSSRTIADSAVGTPQLADDAVATAKIADGAVEIVHLSAAAKASLTKRLLLGTFLFGVGDAPGAGTSFVKQSNYAPGIPAGAVLLANLYISGITPPANITDSTIYRDLAVTPLVNGNQYGVSVHNVSASAIASLAGYAVDIVALVDP